MKSRMKTAVLFAVLGTKIKSIENISVSFIVYDSKLVFFLFYHMYLLFNF